MIRVQPDEGVTIRFGSKVPGAGMQVRDVTMDFGYGHAFTYATKEGWGEIDSEDYLTGVDAALERLEAARRAGFRQATPFAKTARRGGGGG